MVIILTFLGALAFFACMMFIQQKSLRIILATLTGIIFVGSTLLMTLNYSHHFGMQKVTGCNLEPAPPAKIIPFLDI